MPALTANSVTLDEVLEVRAGPLKEEELWAILGQSSEALQDVLIKGKARRKGLLTYTITPESLLLCHNGKVKFSLHTVSSRNRSFTAPEIHSKHNKPIGSEATLEKICIYSLGMTLYHAAEYEIPVGKPVNLSESLEGVLLSMCEESSQLRAPLLKVLEFCHAHRKRRRFGDVIASMVTAVLGDDVPENDSDDHSFDEETVRVNHSELMNGAEVLLISSPDLSSPHSLPSPPLSRISTKAQPTSQELVGSNYRRSGSPNELNLSPRRSKQIPHILDKYKDHLDRSRRDRNQSNAPSNSSVGLSSAHQSKTSAHNQSESSIYEPTNSSTHEHARPGSSATLQNGMSRGPVLLSSSQNLDKFGQDHTPEAGFIEVPAKGLGSEKQIRPDLVSSSRISTLRRYDSDASLTDSSSVVSGPQSSMLSDGRSSMMSIMQGSYVPDSYLTDGYESEPYLTSIGSSASRAAFRSGKDSPLSSYRQYSSTVDLRKQVLSQKSFPEIDSVDRGHPPPQRFLSVPDIRVSREASKSTKPRSGSKNKLGAFFGPEFVQVAEDPNLSVVNITPRKVGSIPHGRRLVTVIVLNGQNLQIMTETNATTQGLFDQVIKYLGLTEKYFFGLTQLQDEEHIFLDLDVKLAKYAPPKWKEQVKVPTVPMEQFVLHFRVKFYVENIALLSYQKTIHQFYLQLRQDILNGQLYCHEEASFILGGLALQAETGDYNESLGDEYFLPEHYVPSRIIDKVSIDHATKQLPHFHKEFQGLTDEQAELEFIKEAQKLQEYGIHFYKVQRKLPASGKSKKKDKETLWIGICIRGVTVYEARGHLKFPTHRHSWPMTKKLSFKKKKFLIEPRGTPDVPKMTFYTNHYKKARYLLQMSQAFHRFQMKMKTKMAILEQEMSIDQSEPRVENEMVESLRQSPYRKSSQPSMQPLSSHAKTSQSRRQTSLESNQLPSDMLRGVPVGYENNTRRRYSSASDSESSSVYQMSNEVSPRKLSDTSPRKLPQDVDDERDVDVPYVIDSTLNSQKVEQVRSRDLQAPDGMKISETFASPDREIRVIKFTKEPGKRLGITVLGGENSKRLDLGIYVKSVTEGGAAWRDGRLKAGDRIVSVNGKSLERVTHEHAVNILKNVTSPVELRVLQSSYNVSSFDLSSIPYASSGDEQPESLAVKPLTPGESSSAEPEIPRDSPTETTSATRPSTFAFPSEDEPVTMISKSIPPSATSVSNRTSKVSQLGKDSDDPFKVSQDSEDSRETTAQSRSHSVPLLEANIIQSSLLSAAAPLVSAGVASPLGESPGSPQESLSGEESSIYSEDAFPEGAFVVDLEKKEGSLGLSVSGGINTSVKLGGIYIKSLQPNGPADLDGRVNVGDRILAVNGISLIGVTHKQAVETVKMAPHRTRLVLDRSIPVNVPKSAGKKMRPHATNKPFMVELLKGVGGLGLSMVGGKGAGEEHGGLLRIKKMFPGQPAASCGKLQIGDIVLEVNGNSMQGVTHQEAINLIRTGPSEVKLLMKREPASIPQSLLQRSGSNASDVDPAQILADIQNKLKTDSPSLSKRSSGSSTREQLSNSNSLEITDEVPVTEAAAVINEAPVSLRSSLISDVAVKQPHTTQSSHPSLAGRLSEPVVTQARKEHETLAATTSLPTFTSVRPKEIPKVNRQEAFQQSTEDEDEDADVTSLGDAPLAEDESSDVEDSRRSSAIIDILPPDLSMYDKQDEVNNRDKTTVPVTDMEKDKKSTSLTPQEEVLYIELTKGSGGLGFTLAGGANTVGGCFVRDIVGGPAKEDGRLQAGDQILAVDGEDISSLKHMDAVNALRATKQIVKLKVLRRPAGFVGSTQSGTVEVVNLTRTSQGRIGLLIKEGDDQKIYVEDVVPGEPAATQGALRQGDRILEINGTKVDGLGFVAARQHLDAARPVARLLVERRPRLAESKYAMAKPTSFEAHDKSWSLDTPDTNTAGSSDESDGVFMKDDRDGKKENDNDDEESQGEHFNVTLNKGPRGFGFSLVAAPTFSSDAHGIFIKTISPGSVAESDGRLKVGDQILKVNREDVQGLSHAKVIGMLRKITGTVELEIYRPAKLYMSDSVTTPPLSPLRSPGTQSNVPPTKAPTEPSPHSVDLDITLEDKDKTLTGSSDIQDEDDVTELLNAISAENDTPSPRTADMQPKPKLNKRDTDMVLSSLLESLQPPPSPPESPLSVDPREVDSQWESGYSDNDAPPDLVPNKLQQNVKTASSSSAHSTIALNGREDTPETSNNALAVNHAITKQMDSISDNDTATDNDVNDSSDGDDDDDYVNMDDEDVFDMLRDNSQLVINMLNNDNPQPTNEVHNNNIGNKNGSTVHNSLEVHAQSDVPPPIPTTPLPSDDDEPPVKPPPRRESLPKFSGNDSSEESYSSPVVNGSVNGHSSGDELTAPSEPLIDVIDGGQYTGDNLTKLIRDVQEKIQSNNPAEEFRALREIKQTDGCDSGKRPANKDKNRYRNVLPFEKTRVRLIGDDDGDYINASHVKIPVGDVVYNYIATQGPLPNTTHDFWQMVWEQHVVVIAMVTLEQEGGKVKCHRYWPSSEDQPLVFTERMVVSLQRQEDFGSFVEREFELSNLQTGETRTVSHINFIAWPDHGVPKSAVELVEFVRFLRLLSEGPGPVVVHCSAGIGRTGALITIDVAIGLMERDLPFDVNKIVRNIREQRQGMIQTKDQYIFCYKACLEVLMSLTAS